MNNLLSDIPAMAIATDTVDSGITRTPRRWDIGYVRRFMICFGLVSSLFDVLTFAFLLLVAHVQATPFQTGWFMESLVTQLGTLLVIRTRRPVWRSRPGKWLVGLVAAMIVLAVAVPFTPLGDWFGFSPPSPALIGGLAIITLLYFVALEAVKYWFFRRERHRPRRKRTSR